MFLSSYRFERNTILNQFARVFFGLLPKFFSSTRNLICSRDKLDFSRSQFYLTSVFLDVKIVRVLDTRLRLRIWVLYSPLLIDLLHSEAAEQVETDPTKKHKVNDAILKEIPGSQFAHLEKFSLSFSSLLFVIRVNLPHSWYFMVYNHLFDVFLS